MKCSLRTSNECICTIYKHTISGSMQDSMTTYISRVQLNRSGKTRLTISVRFVRTAARISHVSPTMPVCHRGCGRVAMRLRLVGQSSTKKENHYAESLPA